MIDEKCFSKSWIMGLRERYTGADPTLLEKTIYAFELLGSLAKHNLDFVFKGGTSLLLLLPDFGRLSIDVDIVYPGKPDQLTAVFDQITKNKLFKKWEENTRLSDQIPKKHFKFFYTSVINSYEDYVLLDILNEKNLYKKIHHKTIQSDLFKFSEEQSINLPSIESITGDKLTAFSPGTVGIPYNSSKIMQLVKQLFDLGELFLHLNNIGEMKSVFNNFLNSENSYRGTTFTIEDAARDLIDIALMICQIDLKGSSENDRTRLLRKGIQQVKSHLINRNFTLNDAKIAASRVAVLAGLLMENSIPSKEKLYFSEAGSNEIREISLTQKFKSLNRIKPILPEVFYNWHLLSSSQK